tara:strand:+ start:628 stop:735 length:108 start_codon:yes stop_codon:yes gene_type:complete
MWFEEFNKRIAMVVNDSALGAYLKTGQIISRILKL